MKIEYLIELCQLQIFILHKFYTLMVGFYGYFASMDYDIDLYSSSLSSTICLDLK